MKIYSFPHGGISFNDTAAPSRDGSILSFLPSISIIPLERRSGGKSHPVVSDGDMVKEGQLIAVAQDSGSTNIYSPVPGKVIDTITSNAAQGILCNSLVIRMEGSFSILGKKEKTYSWSNLSSSKIQRIIADYGLFSMNGTDELLIDAILRHTDHKKSVSLIVNCVFDDMWLVAEYMTCKERRESVALGALLTAAAVHAKNIVIAVSAPESDLGFALSDNIKTINSSLENKAIQNIDSVLTGSRYPQRNKRELEISLRKYEKTEKKDFGEILIVTPSALCAVSDAVTLRKPVLERFVAVGGSAVRHPKVLKARIGSRFRQLFEECGGFTVKPKRIATGSPLLGQPVFSLDEPLTASDYAVFAIGNKKNSLTGGRHILDLRMENRLNWTSRKFLSGFFKQNYAAAQNCIGCGECRAVCPVELNPEDIYKMLLSGKYTKKTTELIVNCHGCGCCEAVCPSRLPILRVFSDHIGAVD